MFRVLALAIAFLAPLPATAVTLGTFTNDYTSFTDTTGANAGTYDFLNDGGSSNSTQLTDSFDISSLAGNVIEELVITITYYAARTAFPSEAWFLDLYGSNPGSTIDDLSFALTDPVPGGLDISTYTVTAILDVGAVDVFANAVANLALDYGFRESSSGNDTVRIYDATLTVNGTAPVPLPASGLLLLAALAGMTFMRRRKALAA